MSDQNRSTLLAVSYWLAAPALLIGPLLSYLKFNGYPLYAYEALLAIALFVAVGLAISLANQKASPPVRVGLMTLTSVAILDQFFVGAGEHGPEAAITAIASVVGLGLVPVVYLIVIIALAYFWARIAFAHVLVAVSFGVMAIAIAVTPAGTTQITSRNILKDVPINADLPPLLHIIVDEHQGLAGFPADVPGGTGLAQDLQQRYRDLGFAVYPNAYSSYAQTAFAIPALLNNETGRIVGKSLSWRDGVATLKKNRWLSSLASQGYQVRVYGSSYLDFCEDEAVHFCQRYPRNSIQSLFATDLPATQKARVIIDTFSDGLLAVWFANQAIQGIRKLFLDWSVETDPAWQKKAPRLGPLAAHATLTDVAADIQAGAAGRAFFAHLILPHYSYVFEEDCKLVQNAGLWLNRDQQIGRNSAQGREMRYRRYVQQTKCVHTALQEVYAALKSVEMFDKSIIVLHGDHGSRIGRMNVNPSTQDMVSRQDLIDTYSTFYAVKTPGTAGAVHLDVRSIQELFAHHFSKSALNDHNDPLYLRDEVGSKGPTNLEKPLRTITMPLDFPRTEKATNSTIIEN